ncbi:MAG: OB-fold domain-containing protein, partial [Solirubrobacteraceae bacterium]
WVVYRRAYHPAFADRVPYNVIVAELDEGPRLISNVVGIEAGDGLFLDAPLLLAPEREGEVPVARFRLAEREHEQGQQQQGQERVER